jgi:hypothetical protein
MKKGNGFLSLRGAVSLAAVFICILWAAAQYQSAGDGRGTAAASPAADATGYKNYLVVCAGPSNVWLAGESGAAAGVSALGADGTCGLALHDDGSVTRVGGDPAASGVSESRFASLDEAAAAGVDAVFTNGLAMRIPETGQGSRHAPKGQEEAVAAAEGGLHGIALWADGSVTCQGDIRRVPARVTNAVAVGASSLNVWTLSADGAVDAWGASFLPGGLRVSAKGPAACGILDARVTDSGLCLLLARAREGLLEGDADGDGVPGVEEVFLHGTDPLAKGAPAVAGASSGPEARPARTKPGAAAVAKSALLYSLGSGTAYYADASRADDSGDGLSWGTAKRTIQAAVDAAQTGDTVTVTNGVYGEGTRITPGGLFQNRLVITNGVLVKSVNGAGVTVIQGSGADCFDTADAVRCVFIADGVLDGFTLQGGAAVAHWTSPDPRDKSGGCLCMGEATAGSEARNCIITGGMAYDGGGVWGGRLVNCLILNCNAYYPAGADSCVLLNCTVTANGNGNWGWACIGGARWSGVTNSVIYGNSGWQSYNCGGCAVYRSCSDPDYFGLGNTAEDVLFADPLFADAANGDCRLQAGSPCIDAGSNAFVTADTDLPGAPRVQGAAVDMGAYEFLTDTDGDGVPDYLDAFPLDAAAWLDTDGDGMPDELHGTSATGLIEDTDDDNDGMPDGWEAANGLNPLVDDAGLDPDGDGLCNLDESAYGTDPFNPDSDNDGLDDCEEVFSRVCEWGRYSVNGYSAVSKPAHLGKVIAVSANYHNRAALRADGTVVCWGRNDGGQCEVPDDLTNAVSVSAGLGFHLALRADGTVTDWGSPTAALPGNLTDAVAIAAGALRSVALRTNGTVVCWGSTWLGTCEVPVGLTNVVAVTEGASHSAALRSDGTVLCWGNNSNGQCGTPTGLAGVVSINAADNFTAALKSDGTVVCWGRNDNGRCDVPVGLTNAVTITAGTYHALAYTRDGRVVGWGLNSEGEAASFRPHVPVLGLAAGQRSSFALVGGCTDPNDPDSDGDGLEDGEEAAIDGTDPNNQDTDGDGLADGWEVSHGLDPLNGTDGGEDLDGDGMGNAWEAAHGLNPDDASDAALDADGDGLTNLDECLLGTDPNSAASSAPGATSASSPVFGSGAAGLLILTPAAVCD